MSKAEGERRGEGSPGIIARKMAGRRLSLIPYGSADLGPMPPLQRQAASPASPASEPKSGSRAEAGGASDESAKRVQTTVKAEEVADRVYEMLRREMKLDRERAGRR